MKVIFLDIDGVMLPYNRQTGYANPVNTPHLVTFGLLSSFIKQTDVKVVISSAWRTGGPRTWDHLMNLLGSTVERSIIGKTPVLGGDSPQEHRSDEIERWLKDRPGIQEWASLDDFELRPSTHPIKIAPYIGLTDWDLQLARYVLGIKSVGG